MTSTSRRCSRSAPTAAILASAHVRTSEFARLIRLWHDGAAAEARQLGHRLTAVAQALFAEPNPVVIKAVLHRLGQIPSPAVRLPLRARQPGGCRTQPRAWPTG